MLCLPLSYANRSNGIDTVDSIQTHQTMATRLLRFKEYTEINEAFADIATKQWAFLEDAQDEIFEPGNGPKAQAFMASIARALHLPVDKVVHANNLSDQAGVQLFMNKIEDETAKKIKSFDMPAPGNDGKNITIEVYDMKTFVFAYFPLMVGKKPTDNIVISEKALDKLADE